MEKGAWQEIPGAPGTFVHPLVRRADVLSCNSYLLEGRDGRALIDCGALRAQTQDLRGILARREAAAGVRSLGVLLTHCHHDHSAEAAAWQADAARPVWLAAQEDGARALEAGDARWTAADLYGTLTPAARVDRPLLAGSASSERIGLGGGAAVEALACPGHSPDGVCYRVGRLLFVGDLLVANRPLVAGISGWDRERVKNSFRLVLDLLERGEAEWCCPGHGDMLPAARALDVLRRELAKADVAEDVEEMGLRRLFRTVETALDLIDEAEEVFASIAGRLLYVAERMEELGETATARSCREAMDMDGVDGLLDAYRTLCRALDEGGLPRVAFAGEALGIVEQLRKRFAADRIEALVPGPLVRRARRLLLDFVGVARGAGNREEFVSTSAGDLLREAQRAWAGNPGADDATWSALDDADAFAADLARRIARPPSARRAAVSFEMADGAGEGMIAAAARFADVLADFLDGLVRGGAGPARAVARRGGIDVATQGGSVAARTGEGNKREAFGRRFALCGFVLEDSACGFALHSRS